MGGLLDGKTEDGEPITTIILSYGGPSGLLEVEGKFVTICDLEPSGAKFNRPVTLIFVYDPGDIPPGIDEKDLVLVAFDSRTQQWQEVGDTTINRERHSITASIIKLAPFGVVAPYKEAPVDLRVIRIAAIIVLAIVLAVILGISLWSRSPRNHRPK